MDNGASAGGDDEVAAGFECFDGVGLELSEVGFAMLCEDVGDALVGLFFDHFIGVEKIEVEEGGYLSTDGGFPCSHETDKGQVLDVAGGVCHVWGIFMRDLGVASSLDAVGGGVGVMGVMGVMGIMGIMGVVVFVFQMGRSWVNDC